MTLKSYEELVYIIYIQQPTSKVLFLDEFALLVEGLELLHEEVVRNWCVEDVAVEGNEFQLLSIFLQLWKQLKCKTKQ